MSKIIPGQPPRRQGSFAQEPAVWPSPRKCEAPGNIADTARRQEGAVCVTAAGIGGRAGRLSQWADGTQGRRLGYDMLKARSQAHAVRSVSPAGRGGIVKAGMKRLQRINPQPDTHTHSLCTLSLSYISHKICAKNTTDPMMAREFVFKNPTSPGAADAT